MSVSTSTKALIGILVAGTVGILIFLFVHLSSGPSGTIQIGTQKASACTKGQQDCIPELTYVDTIGHAYAPKDLAGKVVVVNFWATWCAPCQKEIPDLSRIYEKYKDKGLVMLGVLSDNADNQALLNFQSDYDMRFPVVRATSEILAAYQHPSGLPSTFVFDRGGRQVTKHLGPLHESQLDQILSPLLAQASN